MNKLGLIFLTSLATAGAYAQGTSGVTTSTDPARAAAVEKHAEELQARQSKEAATKPASGHANTHKKEAKASTTHKSSSHASSTHKSSTHKSSTPPSSTHASSTHKSSAHKSSTTKAASPPKS